jgi:hypothetical protein
MLRIVVCLIAVVLLGAVPAGAQNCTGSFPTTLANGTNADATQVMANFTYLLNCINNLPTPSAGATVSATRQTVSAGPVTTAGLPNFLPASSGSLSITMQNVTAAAPFTVTAANNNDSTTGAQKDQIGVTTSNLTWSSLAASATSYLYVTVASNGTLTAGATTLAPVYQWGGTPGTANGQFTFNIGEMRGYLGNGSTAAQAYVVVVGEAVTSGSAVTSAVGYAYNGRYDSGFTSTLPNGGTQVSRSHNIGIHPNRVDFIIECITSDLNYGVGDQIHIGSIYTDDAVSNILPSLSGGRLSMTIIASTGAYWKLLNKSTGANGGGLTLARWKYKFVAERGW